MLHLLRDFAKTPIAKVLLAVLVVGFGALGINNVITDFGSNNVASVGGVDITTQDFQRAYQNAVNAYAQQSGAMPTPQQAVQLGIPGYVLNRLEADAALDQFGQQLGLGVSDDRKAAMLQQEPSFKNPLGQFDKQTFEQVLQQQGMTDAQFLDQEAKQGRQQQIEAAFFEDTPVPQTTLDIVNRFGTDARTLSYFVLNVTNIPSIPDPTDADLTAFLKDHQADYRTQETRTVDVMTFSPAILAAAKQPTDAEIQAEYDSTKASLVKVEKRDIKQAVLTDDQAKVFTDGQAAGKSFDDLVKQTGVTVTDLGVNSKDGLSDGILADAAFGLKQGDFEIIPGISGKRAITVTAIVPGGQETLDEARPEIIKNLALQQATNEIGDDTDQIEDLRAGKQPLTAIAPRYNLKVATVTLAADGTALSAVPDIADADRAKVAQAIFTAKQGGLSPSVQLSNSQNVWFDLKHVDPARDQTLAEVRDRLAAAWTKEKTDAAMKAEADKIVGDLKAGKSFDDVAAGLNQLPIISSPITRQGDQSTGGTTVLDQTVAQAAFAGGSTHFGYAVDNDGDYVVFQVTSVIPASAPLSAQTTAQLQTSVRNSLASDFVIGLRQDAGIRTYQNALNQVLAVDPSSSGN